MSAARIPPVGAIETIVGDYHCRSRLEARWIVFFLSLQFDFQYEPEGFELPSGRYLPDFYFPTIRMFGEVKPIDFTEQERIKCTELADASNCPVLLLIGPPGYKTYLAIHAVDLGDGPVERFETDYTLDIDAHARRHYRAGRLFGSLEAWRENQPEWLFSQPYQQAVKAARSARFGDGGRW